jgi:serine/threonine protein kinase
MDDIAPSTVLGYGTFGKVVLATHVPTNRPYALKILSKRKVCRFWFPYVGLHNPSRCVCVRAQILELKQQKNVMFERAVLSLGHPFMVRLVQTFQDAKHLYMLMDLVPGGELFSLLGEVGMLSTDHARFYTACVVDVLACLHARRIVYRDIKPENLLVDADGYLRVVDFGFSKHVPGRTFTLCGTPEYLAPEIIVGHGYTIAVDFW